MQDIAEVADRVWVARHAQPDLNVTAVAGEHALLLVDPPAAPDAAASLLAGLRRLAAAPLLFVVNTHAHPEHVLGNAEVRRDSPGVRVLAHEAAVPAMPGSPLVLPDESFSSVRVLDLGDRYVEVVHCGRGHTAGDVVVRVPEADVVVAGDLVVQASPPSYGDDCWPLEWPATLEMVAQLTTPTTVVVPGHGRVVDQPFVHDQRHDVGVVAETVQQLAAAGAGLEEALRHDQWPFPRALLEHAVRRGYAHLPPAARRLPMA